MRQQPLSLIRGMVSQQGPGAPTQCSLEPFSCQGCAALPCNHEGPRLWWEQREGWAPEGFWGPASAVGMEGNLEPLSPGITVPAAICPLLQVRNNQCKDLWKVSDFLGHHRSLWERDPLSLFHRMLCLQLAGEVTMRPVALVAQGQCQPSRALPTLPASQPARGPPAGTVTSAF